MYAHITFVMHAHIFICIYGSSQAMNIECVILAFLVISYTQFQKKWKFQKLLILYRQYPFTIVQLKIFQIYNGTKVICIQEKLCCKFWILVFSRIVIHCHPVSSRDAGLGQQAAAPGQPCDPKDKQQIHLTLLYPKNHSVLSFQYSFQ